ncbi:GH10700 [Drosophila grimshawi]|uniref:GH10700 n=2 Tax=Drosophila grimshawi TaxID=7222 RepID=B4JC50_DROGR|nr:GH10700 [Drosophila grimshawi]
MAFSGHLDADGNIVFSNESYVGRTCISSLTTSSDHSKESHYSEQSGSDSLEFLSGQRWEPPSNLQAISKLFYKNQDESPNSSSSPLSLPTAGGNIYSSNNGRTKSLYSFKEMYGSLKRTDTETTVLPSLELRSRCSTLDYMRDLKGLKLDREPQVAYNTWYAAKQRQRKQLLQSQKTLFENEQQKKEQRKLQSKLCYEKWLRDKSRLASERRLENHMQHAALKAATSVAGGSPSNNKPVRSVTQSEIIHVVQSWWMKKQQQQQRQREEKQYHLLKKRRDEQLRKQLAENAWQKWMSNVYDKPKPVPMNQGIDSLRGTVSQIYINPMSWEPLENIKKSDYVTS